MKLKNGVYDVLKWIALIGLPAISTLIFTIGSIWNFGYISEMVGTIAAIETFLGVVLGISTSSYNSEMKNESDKQ